VGKFNFTFRRGENKITVFLNCFKISPGVIQIELIYGGVSEHFFYSPPGYKNLNFFNRGECFSTVASILPNFELFFHRGFHRVDLTGVLTGVLESMLISNIMIQVFKIDGKYH